MNVEEKAVSNGLALSGLRVLVTGAASGLGAATCRLLAVQGCSVAINHLPAEQAQAEELAQHCRGEGVEALTLAADVGDDDACRQMALELEVWGELHGLVNSAGVTRHVPDHSDMDALSAEDFLAVYRVNVVGGFQVLRATRRLLEAGAATLGHASSVVNVSSLSALSGGGSSAAYCASKGALNTLTLSMARALAPAIRVNAVCPAYIDTGWFARGQGEAADRALKEAVEANVPLGAALTPLDVAYQLAFLLSPSSRYQTGEITHIDSGHRLLEF
ncbi:MAG: SDR family oxidoreductase [Pseudomonadota bacterium]